MTHSELEALRRLLFFSATEAAAMIGGVAEQTWRRWEAGSRAVPEDVAGHIVELVDWRDQALDSIFEMIESLGGGGAILVWYESIDDWASLPAREAALWRPHQSACAAALAKLGEQIRLVPFNGPVYAQWLAGREDNETMRGQWAAQAG